MSIEAEGGTMPQSDWYAVEVIVGPQDADPPKPGWTLIERANGRSLWWRPVGAHRRGRRVCRNVAAHVVTIETEGARRMQRFTAYRRNISQRDTHNELQKNADHEPQFEGVIWSDGTVTLRWLTACRSTSVWASLEDCLAIHGHPEYGTEILWHDTPTPPEEWLRRLST